MITIIVIQIPVKTMHRVSIPKRITTAIVLKDGKEKIVAFPGYSVTILLAMMVSDKSNLLLIISMIFWQNFYVWWRLMSN